MDFLGFYKNSSFKNFNNSFELLIEQVTAAASKKIV